MNIPMETAQLRRICEQAQGVLRGKGKTRELGVIDTYWERIDRQEVSVLVCGEFKRGKSSFINAFLGEQVCPVDVGIATSAVSLIRYGEKFRLVRQYGELNDLKTEELSSRDDIERYAKGSAEEIDNTVLLVIELPNEKLKKGIALFDTPGVGGLDPRHAFLTTYFLPKADAAIFVTDTGEPLTGAEITFFKKKILPYSRQHIVLVNKADSLSSERKVQEWVADVRNKLQERQPLTVIPVSSMLMQDYLDSGDEMSLEESNFAAVEKEIDNLLENVRRGLLLELRDYLIDVFRGILEPIKLKMGQIKVPDPHLIGKLEQELTELRDQKERLSNPNSSYRQKIASTIRQARSQVETRLSEESVLLSTDRLQALLSSPEAKDSTWLLRRLNDGIGSISAELDLMIDAAEDQVIQLLGMNTMHTSAKGFRFEIHTDLSPVERSVGSKVCNVARHVMPGLGIGGLAAGVVASLFTGGIVGGAALLIGAASALGYIGKTVSEASSSEQRAFLAGKLSPQISIAVNHLRNYINNRFEEFNTSLIAAMQQGTQDLIHQMESTLSDLNRLKQETMQQKQLRTKLLEDELKPVEQILGVLKVFLTNPFANVGKVSAERPGSFSRDSRAEASDKGDAGMNHEVTVG